MRSFTAEFHTLQYVFRNATRVLFVAHSGPDSDTTGATCALKEFADARGLAADIACTDDLPAALEPLTRERFIHPDSLDLKIYDVVIGADSVERGYHRFLPFLTERQVTVILDHHPDIRITADVTILDSTASSVCEIVAAFFDYSGATVTPSMATLLLAGIIGDTGGFQHANTSTDAMQTAAKLMRRGADISKIVGATFSNRSMTTLKLWGRAFEKARINATGGMIVTVLTQRDLTDCRASAEDVSMVASILNTVPGAKFSLVLSERDGNIIKGSLRSEEYKGVDVSAIAHRFGGGGHKLASGFEISGRIEETADGWKII